VEQPESLAEGQPLLGVGPFDCRRIRHPQCAVMGWPGQYGHSSPAALSQTVNTKSNGCPGGREFVPALAAQAFSREPHVPEELQRDWMHLPFGMAAGAESLKAAVPAVIDEGLGEDAASRIARA
jgi:hypothetical protein